MIRVDVKPLRDALRAIEKVVERRNTIPILSNVLLSASTRELRLTATDMDVQIERRIVAEGDKPLSITVASAVLAGIVGKLPQDGTATLKPDDAGGVTISCGRSRFKLPTLPVEDFPDMPAVTDGVRFALPAAALLAMIEAVRFAVSSDETRYYLNGVYLHVVSGDDGPMLRAVATDGTRLARSEMLAPEGSGDLGGAIISTKTIDVLRQLLAGVEDSVELAVTQSRIRFRIGDDVLTGKLVDGTYPDYSRVIPHANERRLLIDGGEFATAIDRVSVISTEKTRALKLELAADRVKLSVASVESGSATEECPCDFAGQPITIGFNARYLLDVLRHIAGERAEILIGEANGPVLFRADADAPAAFVLMPLRV